MGVARLLAKGWVLVCLYAGGYELFIVLVSSADPLAAIPELIVCTLLFSAMGLLFIGGFGASAGHGRGPLLKRLKPAHLLPGFNETVFALFVILSFVNQIYFAPLHLSGGVIEAFESAIYFAVFGQRALVDALSSCAVDGGRVFVSSVAWLMALVFLGSALSRLNLSAGILRLERATRPETLGPITLAALLGIAAVIGIQMLFVGSTYQFLPCSLFTGIPGALLIGLAPLMLSYLILAALTALLASGKEHK